MYTSFRGPQNIRSMPKPYTNPITRVKCRWKNDAIEFEILLYWIVALANCWSVCELLCIQNHYLAYASIKIKNICWRIDEFLSKQSLTLQLPTVHHHKTNKRKYYESTWLLCACGLVLIWEMHGNLYDKQSFVHAFQCIPCTNRCKQARVCRELNALWVLFINIIHKNTNTRHLMWRGVDDARQKNKLYVNRTMCRRHWWLE